MGRINIMNYKIDFIKNLHKNFICYVLQKIKGLTIKGMNVILPTYNLLDCITKFGPTTGVAEAALCWKTGTCTSEKK